MVAPIAGTLTDSIKADLPQLHGDGANYFGLAWSALAWLEANVRPGMVTIETGCGASSIVCAARGARHTIVTPAQSEHDRVRAYCSSHGIALDDVTSVVQSSDVALSGAGYWQPEPLDLALIDGAHLFPFPAVDWHFAALNLKVGGRIVIDDAYLPSVAMVVKFMRASPAWELVGAISYRTVVFEKRSDEVGTDTVGSRFDRFPNFGYLKPGPRLLALARYWLLVRTRLLERLPRRR